jgi:hypothetical protein
MHTALEVCATLLGRGKQRTARASTDPFGRQSMGIAVAIQALIIFALLQKFVFSK